MRVLSDILGLLADLFCLVYVAGDICRDPFPVLRPEQPLALKLPIAFSIQPLALKLPIVFSI